MKMQMIWTIARKWDIPFRVGVTKTDLVREIQKREGFGPCFGTKETCGEELCLWRDDCLPRK
ncbi:MAG: SAP domain-containing protein [Syntrophaceae bacterium]|nr:SAP domain-containing protein [Syntrophaceae bacterium]